MKTDEAFLVPVHPDMFRPGEPVRIIGVKMVMPSERAGWRLCYHVMYPDGHEDYVAVHDNKTYKLIGFQDIVDGNIPCIK